MRIAELAEVLGRWLPEKDRRVVTGREHGLPARLHPREGRDDAVVIVERGGRFPRRGGSEHNVRVHGRRGEET